MRESFLVNSHLAPDVIVALAERWQSNGLQVCFDLLYQVRDQWWHNDNLRSRMIRIIDKRYESLRYLDYRKVPVDQIDFCCEMILCYSYCHCMTNAIGLCQLLSDKRIQRDFSHYPMIGHHLPMPSRVCDHALMSLFILYEVDVGIVSKRYGYPLMFDERPGSPQIQVEQAFNAMIRDWPKLRVRFSQKQKP